MAGTHDEAVRKRAIRIGVARDLPIAAGRYDAAFRPKGGTLPAEPGRARASDRVCGRLIDLRWPCDESESSCP